MTALGQGHAVEAASDRAAAPGAIAGRYVIVGAVCGLAWAAGFRAYMMQLAGPASEFDWFGTFGAILAPGVLVGALLGLATAMLAAHRGRGVRWLALAPLLFAIAPLVRPGALFDLFTQGLGGGAVGIALVAIAGGFSFGQVGPLWTRIVCGVIAWTGALGTAAMVPLIRGAEGTLTQPENAWAAVLALSFVAVLMLATAIPFHRLPVVDRAAGERG